jgi:hypothetical protein
LYINGVGAGGTQNGSSSLNVAHNENYPIRMGLRSRYGPTYFIGALDEVYLWNRVLTPDEIQEIVDGGLITKTREIIESDLKIHPNPASDQILISGLSKIKQEEIYFEMVDLYGQVIKSGKLDTFEENRVNVRDVPTGSYFFRFITEGSIQSSGIIILSK